MDSRIVVAPFLRISLSLTWCLGLPASAAPREPDPAAGRELFTREWLPQDRRASAGDGLGPLFNDTSCVACHNQGGIGGAGPEAKNVLMASVFRNPPRESAPSSPPKPARLAMVFSPDAPPAKQPAIISRPIPVGKEPKPTPKVAAASPGRSDVALIHPAFKTSNSIVVHHFGTSSEYASFRSTLFGFGSAFRTSIPAETAFCADCDLVELPAGAIPRTAPSRVQIGDFTLLFGRRNTPALYGSGLIDTIPDRVLRAAEEKTHFEYPEVSGRVARLADGKLGRFGWKAQKARLVEFVLAACANELGLEVPGEHQPLLPYQLSYKSPGHDLSQSQCDELTAFVASLPAPLQIEQREGNFLKEGRLLFERVGCAVCHTRELGSVAGIYSDLLLHDMGQRMSDSGGYGLQLPPEESGDAVPQLAQAGKGRGGNRKDKDKENAKLTIATRSEWRTPPLWGVRDSAPYLHDGRAQTLEQAIAQHGGEATRSMTQFFKLSADEQLQVTLFLRSLAAPEPE